MKIEVFVSSLGAYNNGVLTGQWTTLPVDDVQEEILDKIDGSVGDEFFITDYEAPFKINQYVDLKALNELVKALENFEDIEEVYWRIDGRENLSVPEVYEFTDDFFETMFLSPAEAARATFFGDIQNWLDEYIYFNGYGNLESMSKYQFKSEIEEAANEIIEQFCEENDLEQVD